VISQSRKESVLEDIRARARHLSGNMKNVSLSLLLGFGVSIYKIVVVVAVDNFFFKHVYAGENLWIIC
jgi:hypothetical protein